jgi:hypothetical protein
LAMHRSSTPGVNWQPGLGWFPNSTPVVARSGSGACPSVETAISGVSWFMGHAQICAGPDTGKCSAQYGKRTCSRADRPMSFWWRWPTRQPELSGQCLAEGKPSEQKLEWPHNAGRKQLYCEGDIDVMAKQGNRDRPNPRQCPSLELAALTGRRSTDSIRARGYRQRRIERPDR